MGRRRYPVLGSGYTSFTLRPIHGYLDKGLRYDGSGEPSVAFGAWGTHDLSNIHLDWATTIGLLYCLAVSGRDTGAGLSMSHPPPQHARLSLRELGAGGAGLQTQRVGAAAVPRARRRRRVGKPG